MLFQISTKQKYTIAALLFILVSIAIALGLVIASSPKTATTVIHPPKRFDTPQFRERGILISPPKKTFKKHTASTSVAKSVLEREKQIEELSHQAKPEIEKIVEIYKPNPTKQKKLQKRAKDIIEIQQDEFFKKAKSFDDTWVYGDLLGDQSRVNTGGGGGLEILKESASAKELHTYGNELAVKMEAFRKSQGNQTARFDGFFKKKNESTKKDILKLAVRYKQFADAMDELQTPTGIREIHSRIKNNFISLSGAMQKMAILTDDLKLYPAALAFNTESGKLAKSTLALIKTFAAQGVVFKKGEPGEIFMFTGSGL